MDILDKLDAGFGIFCLVVICGLIIGYMWDSDSGLYEKIKIAIAVVGFSFVMFGLAKFLY